MDKMQTGNDLEAEARWLTIRLLLLRISMKYFFHFIWSSEAFLCLCSPAPAGVGEGDRQGGPVPAQLRHHRPRLLRPGTFLPVPVPSCCIRPHQLSATGRDSGRRHPPTRTKPSFLLLPVVQCAWELHTHTNKMYLKIAKKSLLWNLGIYFLHFCCNQSLWPNSWIFR
jgi:hypothetical protein